MPSSVKLRAEGLRVVRPDGRVVLDGVDLDVLAGEALALVGPSGAGKTTLLRLLDDLEAPTAGRVLLDGVPVTEIPPAALRRRVGYVAQVPRSLASAVADELAFGPRLAGREPPRAELADALAGVGLPAATLERPMERLSQGEQQRVAIARALVLRPEVLLLDEPTSALDPAAAQSLLALLAALRRSARGLTLVVVTHGLEQARQLADRIALLQAGRITDVAPTATFFGAEAGAAARAFLDSGRLPDGPATAPAG